MSTPTRQPQYLVVLPAIFAAGLVHGLLPSVDMWVRAGLAGAAAGLAALTAKYLAGRFSRRPTSDGRP